MPTATTTRTTVTPYLAVHDAAAALAFYGDAFDAAEDERIVGPDGRIGHAAFHIAGARFYLADEYPEIGVTSPRALGGTTVTLHLEVADVDAAYSRAIDAGATPLLEPADQPHGARHGTLTDPFGHRWMLSTAVESFTPNEYRDRMADAGYEVQRVSSSGTTSGGGIWAAITSVDAHAMIRFATDVLGFTEQIVVPGDRPGEVIHSQLAWPEGGIVQVGTAHREGNEFSERPVGGQSLYVITADPRAVYDRCVAAGVEIIREMETPEYDPEGSGFAIRDHEGNLWSFGTYGGE